MTTLHDQWTALYTAGRVRWMPGMLTMFDPVLMPRVIGSAAVDYGLRHRVTGVERNHWYGVTQHHDDYPDALHENESGGSPESFPDFSDPATIGCLLHQAREAWNDKGLTVVGEFVPPFAPSWRAMGGHLHGAGFQRLAMIGHDSEPAAILAAIAAAPPKVTE
jgi:hypothetical protein